MEASSYTTPHDMETDTMSPAKRRRFRELQAARHNAFLLTDVLTLSQILMEATICVDAAIAINDKSGLQDYRALMNGTKADISRLRKDV